MTRTGVTLFVLIGVAWLCFLSLVMPGPASPTNDLLRDVAPADRRSTTPGIAHRHADQWQARRLQHRLEVDHDGSHRNRRGRLRYPQPALHGSVGNRLSAGHDARAREGHNRPRHSGNGLSLRRRRAAKSEGSRGAGTTRTCYADCYAEKIIAQYQSRNLCFCMFLKQSES